MSSESIFLSITHLAAVIGLHGHQQVPTLTMTFTCMFKIFPTILFIGFQNLSQISIDGDMIISTLNSDQYSTKFKGPLQNSSIIVENLKLHR